MRYLYVLSVENKYFKIGVANNVRKRIMNMQGCCPYPIKIIHEIKVPDQFVKLAESFLHKRYKGNHALREWFQLSEDQTKELTSLDTSSLISMIGGKRDANQENEDIDHTIYQTTSLSIYPEIFREVQKISKATDIPVSRLLRKAVHEWLEEYRHDSDLARAHAAMQKSMSERVEMA